VRDDAAIEVRCAGRGGRCRQLLAVAYTILDRRPDGAVLRVVNAPWMGQAGWPRYEARVPPDFSGVIDGVVLGCPKHPVQLAENLAMPVSAEPMPCDMLRKPYERFLANPEHKTESVKWLPRRRGSIR
jgi:hypothetical protein